MVHGLLQAFIAVTPTLLVVGILIFVFAVILNMTLKGYHDDPEVYQNYRSLNWCMWTLLMDGCFMDNPGENTRALLEISQFETGTAVLLFIMFILLTAVTMMNMIIGVICKVVNEITVKERDAAAVLALKKSVLCELRKYDVNGDNSISREELNNVMSNEETLHVLEHVEIDLQYLKHIQEMLFCGTEEVSITRIMELMLSSRRDLPTTFRHHAEGQLFQVWALESTLEQLEDLVESTSKNHEDMLGKICTMLHEIKGQSLSKLQCGETVGVEWHC